MTKILQIKQKHKFRNELSDIFVPHLNKLGALKADCIGYRQFLADGKTMYYCSTEQYDENFIEPEEMKLHYSKEILLINREGYNFILRSSSNANNSFLQKLLLLDLCNSLIIYQMEENIIHMFCFIFSSSNLSASNYFINKRELFENIVYECKDEVSAICAKDEYSILQDQIFSEKIAKEMFFKAKAQSLQTSKVVYTKRQKQCISLLQRGATNKDISQKLRICLKTVEYHVSNLKDKSKCHNRFGITEKVTL